jgi:hypothetical protein
VSRYGDHVKVFCWGNVYGEWIGEVLCFIEQGEEAERQVSVLMAWMGVKGQRLVGMSESRSGTPGPRCSLFSKAEEEPDIWPPRLVSVHLLLSLCLWYVFV